MSLSLWCVLLYEFVFRERNIIIIPEIIKKSTLFGNYNLLTTLQNLHKILLHIDVDVAVAVEGSAAFGVAGEG